MATYEDYVPRFHVGDRVDANGGTDRERETQVTGRRIYRSRDAGPNTYYTLADGTGAWESSLTIAYERVAPEIAMARIVSAFGHRLAHSALTVARQRNGGHRVHVHLEATHAPDGSLRVARDGSTVARIDLWAEGYADRAVETTGAWSYKLGDDVERVAANLGDVIVTTYNATLNREEIAK